MRQPGRDRVSGDYDALILAHYRDQVTEHGLSPSSTMLDETTRELELEVILQCLAVAAAGFGHLRLLEVGCGNGYTLSAIRERMPTAELVGLDSCAEMIALARQRDIEQCTLSIGDVRSLALESESFDVVVSQRCLINVLDRDHQALAIEEIHRVLRPGGVAIVTEAFLDGLANLNRARQELGLASNNVPEFNLWFDKSWFLSTTRERFELANVNAEPRDGYPTANFLSSHYFMSRVVYPAITQAAIQYNTEFVRFWRFLPAIGDFSPIQLVVLRKPGA